MAGLGENSNPLVARIQKITQQEINNVMKPQKGVVVVYNNEHNYCMAEIDNPYGGGKMLLEYVPVQMSGGVHTAGPFVGDEVWIEFTSGKLELPKVVGFADRQYEKETREKKMKHKKKGANIPERLSKQIHPDYAFRKTGR